MLDAYFILPNSSDITLPDLSFLAFAFDNLSTTFLVVPGKAFLAIEPKPFIILPPKNVSARQLILV